MTRVRGLVRTGIRAHSGTDSGPCEDQSQAPVRPKFKQ